MVKRLRAPADGPIILLLLTLPLTLYASAWPEITARALALLLAGIALFYTAVLWATTESRLRLGATLLVGAGAALALVAPFSVRWISDAKGFLNFAPVYAAFPHLLPESIHPNVLAGALAALLPVALAWWLNYGGRGPGIGDRGVPGAGAGQESAASPTPDPRRQTPLICSAVSAMPLIVMAAVLILTKSRGALLAATLGLAIVLAHRMVFSVPAPATRAFSLRRPEHFRSWVGLGLLVLAPAAVGAVLAGPVRVVHIAASLAASPVLGGWPGRVELWSRSLDAVADFPLTGIGLGTFEQVVPVRYPYVLLAGSERAIPHAHNLFLQVAVDLGLPGLVAFIALLGISLVAAAHAARRYAKRQRPDLALQSVGLAAGLVAVIVHGLIDAVSWNTKPAIFIWVMMGLIMAHVKTAHDG